MCTSLTKTMLRVLLYYFFCSLSTKATPRFNINALCSLGVSKYFYQCMGRINLEKKLHKHNTS